MNNIPQHIFHENTLLYRSSTFLNRSYFYDIQLDTLPVPVFTCSKNTRVDKRIFPSLCDDYPSEIYSINPALRGHFLPFIGHSVDWIFYSGTTIPSGIWR